MAMKNPPHPGETVRSECPEPLGVSVTEAAKALGITRQALKRRSADAQAYGLACRWITILRRP